MCRVFFILVAILAATRPGFGQEIVNADDVKAGHKIAVDVCSNCHLAAPDQPDKPILRPPALSFELIAQKNSVNAEWLQNFLQTTHRGLDNPKGMPNPQLLGFQVRQVTNYILSLRKKP